LGGYTWTKPGDTGRYQIDYILTECRYWNSVRNAKAGAKPKRKYENPGIQM